VLAFFGRRGFDGARRVVWGRFVPAGENLWVCGASRWAAGNRDVAGGGRIPGDELFSVGGKVGDGFRF
jgi:hypothetical protein